MKGKDLSGASPTDLRSIFGNSNGTFDCFSISIDTGIELNDLKSEDSNDQEGTQINKGSMADYFAMKMKEKKLKLENVESGENGSFSTENMIEATEVNSEDVEEELVVGSIVKRKKKKKQNGANAVEEATPNLDLEEHLNEEIVVESIAKRKNKKKQNETNLFEEVTPNLDLEEHLNEEIVIVEPIVKYKKKKKSIGNPEKKKYFGLTACGSFLFLFSLYVYLIGSEDGGGFISYQVCMCRNNPDVKYTRATYNKLFSFSAHE